MERTTGRATCSSVHRYCNLFVASRSVVTLSELRLRKKARKQRFDAQRLNTQQGLLTGPRLSELLAPSFKRGVLVLVLVSAFLAIV